MKIEKCCGGVVYQIINKKIFFLIEKSIMNYYGFAKGHLENHETSIECAKREIKEETNLDVIIDEKFSIKDQYYLSNGTLKEVTYFLAYHKNGQLKAQENEVSELFFLPFDEAYQKLTFANAKQILLKAYLYLLKKQAKKIIILGCPGSGKSYLTKFLNPFFDLPIYHLDLLYWYGDWKHIEHEDFLLKQQQIMKNDCWIIDGHFQNSIQGRIQNADLAIYFYLPPQTCIRAIKHRIKYHSTRNDMPKSCKESILDEHFENCIRHFRRNNNPIIQKYFEEYGCNVLTIHTKKQLREIIDYINQ